MAFRPRLNSDGISTLRYYNPPDNTYPVSIGNCTWYAFGRFYEEGEPPTLPNLSPADAHTWYGYSDGYERGQTPRLGAILCFSGGNTEAGFSGLGHVAIVEQINADGTIVVSESGYDAYYWRLNTRDPNESYPYSNSFEQYNFQGFIYNPNVNVLTASPYVVSAMCGCWWRESMVNPAIWESLVPSTFDHEYQYDGIGGFGLGQWTNVGTQYGRLYDLHTWVTNNGYQDGDGDGQLAYIPVEGYWVTQPYGGSSPRLSYTTLEEFIASDSTNLNDLVWDFLACWEGVEGDAYTQRLSWARQCYQHILDHQNDDPSQYQWISGNRYLSESETLNNVMVIWFWFSNNEPVPPLPPKKKSLMLYVNKRKFMRKRGLTWR